MKKNLRMKITRILLVGALVFSSSGALTSAASTYVTLHTSQKAASSNYLGNTTGSYKVTGYVYSNSKYGVTYTMCGGTTSANCNKALWSNLYSPSTEVTKYITASTGKYSLGQLNLYGNVPNNQKKECFASGTLYNN